MSSAVLCSLIEHAEISQSQSLIGLFKYFDWLTRQQLSITNWTFAKFFREAFEWPSREE